MVLKNSVKPDTKN